MKQLIKLFIITILFSSCYNYKVAKRQIFKAYDKYPSMTAEISSVLFPIKDSVSIIKEYLPGKIDTVEIEPVLINCDSLIEAAKADTFIKTKFIKAPCPPKTKQTDTLIDHQYHTVENTAKIQFLSLKLQELNDQLIVTQSKSKGYKKWLTWLASIIIGLGLWKAIKMYFKIKFPI